MARESACCAKPAGVRRPPAVEDHLRLARPGDDQEAGRARRRSFTRLRPRRRSCRSPWPSCTCAGSAPESNSSVWSSVAVDDLGIRGVELTSRTFYRRGATDAASAGSAQRRPGGDDHRNRPTTRLWPPVNSGLLAPRARTDCSSARPRPQRHLSQLAFSLERPQGLPGLADLAPRLIHGNDSHLARLGRSAHPSLAHGWSRRRTEGSDACRGPPMWSTMRASDSSGSMASKLRPRPGFILFDPYSTASSPSRYTSYEPGAPARSGGAAGAPTGIVDGGTDVGARPRRGERCGRGASRPMRAAGLASGKTNLRLPPGPQPRHRSL